MALVTVTAVVERVIVVLYEVILTFAVLARFILALTTCSPTGSDAGMASVAFPFFSFTVPASAPSMLNLTLPFLAPLALTLTSSVVRP